MKPVKSGLFFLHLPIANQNPQMNTSPTIGNTISGNNAGDAVLWVAGSADATGNLVESLSYDPWGKRPKAANWKDF